MHTYLAVPRLCTNKDGGVEFKVQHSETALYVPIVAAILGQDDVFGMRQTWNVHEQILLGHGSHAHAHAMWHGFT